MYILLLNGELPLTFTEAKKYDVGTGYIALYEEKERCCILCRCVEEESMYYMGRYHLFCESADEYISKSQRVHRKVIIINDKLKEIAEADSMVDILKIGIRKLNEINKPENKKVVYKARYY